MIHPDEVNVCSYQGAFGLEFLHGVKGGELFLGLETGYVLWTP